MIGAIGEGSLPCRLVRTCVDFLVCVVAPPGERSVGASRWEAARRGVEVSVEGPGRLFVRDGPLRLCGLRRCAHVEKKSIEGVMEL